MSSNSFKVKNSLVLTPKDLSTLVSPEAGDLACDINDSNKIKRYDAASASWVEVGSGGGVGGVDIFFVQDFESASLSSFTQTGLVLSQTDPLKGKVSAVLTHQAAINQSFKQIIPVDRKFRGESVTLSLDAKSSASQGNLVIKITNETASTDIVASEQLVISNDVSGAKSSVTFTIPESCASLSYTITALPQAGSPVSGIDDIICQLTQSVTIQSGLIQDGDSSLSAMGNAAQVITASTTDIPFSLSSLRGSNISYTGSSARFLKAGIYSISVSLKFTTAATRAIELYKNGVLYLRISDALSADQHQGSLTDYFNASDVISIRVAANGGTLSNATTQHYLDINNQGSLKQVTPNSNQKAVIPTSELRFEGATARGSTDTAIVLFSTQSLIRGDAFSVSSTAANGTVVTILKPGRLVVSAGVYSNVASVTFSVSKNQAVRTAVAQQSEVIATGLSLTANSGGCSGVVDVVAGDVIRVSSTVAPTTGAPNFLQLSLQEQSIQVSVSNTLPQYSESDLVVRAAGNSGQAITVAVTDIPFTTIYDSTGGAWNGSQFVVPEDGLYSIDGGIIATTAATGRFQGLHINGVFSRSLNTRNGASEDICKFQGTASLTRGQVISIRELGTTGYTLSNNGSFHYINITKVGKPNVTGVNVTPFVNVPQPDTEFLSATGGSGANAIVSNFSGLSSTSKGIISQTSSRLTALKRCNFSLFVRATSGGAGNRIDIYKNGSLYVTGVTISSGSMLNQVSLLANIGDYFEVYSLGAGGNTGISYEANAEALSDQILTATESFSTDTASLTYAGSGTYTLSTLANAPVGTFITFTYAANTNTRTQTNAAPPSQSTSNMNANGILLYTRAYNAPSTAAQPAAIAIQIGKGMKGVTQSLYKSAEKVTAGNLGYVVIGTTSDVGAKIYNYNEMTGILIIDAGTTSQSTNTSHAFIFSDDTTQTSGYLVINASKNPALTGFGLNRVAARAVQSSGQSIPSGAATTLTWDASKTFDTTGSLNAPTGVFTAPESGYYQVSSGVRSNTNSGVFGTFYVGIFKNGTLYSYANQPKYAAAVVTCQAYISDTIYLAKNDAVTIRAFQDSGGALALTTDPTGNFISITKVSL